MKKTIQVLTIILLSLLIIGVLYIFMNKDRIEEELRMEVKETTEKVVKEELAKEVTNQKEKLTDWVMDKVNIFDVPVNEKDDKEGK